MHLMNNFRLPSNVLPFNIDCPLLTPPIIDFNGFEAFHDYDKCAFFKCTKCDASGSFISNDCHVFYSHLQKNHRDDQLYCVYCYWNDRDYKHKVSYHSNGLISHIISDHSFRKYQCNLCHYRAAFISNVIQHQTISHNKQYEYAISKDTLKKKKICKIIICESIISGPEMNAFMYFDMFKVTPINRNTEMFQCVYCNYVNDRNYVFLHCAHRHADFPMMVYKPVFDDPKMEIQIKTENEKKNLKRKKRSVNVCNDNDSNGNVRKRIDGDDLRAEKRNVDDECERNNEIEEIDMISDDSNDIADITDAVISLNDNFNYISLLQMNHDDNAKRSDHVSHHIPSQNVDVLNVPEDPEVSKRPSNSTDANPQNLKNPGIGHSANDETDCVEITDVDLRGDSHREMLENYRKNPKIHIVRKDKHCDTNKTSESIDECAETMCSIGGDGEWHRDESHKYKHKQLTHDSDNRVGNEKENENKSESFKIPKMDRVNSEDMDNSRPVKDGSNATFSSAVNRKINANVNKNVQKNGPKSKRFKTNSINEQTVNDKKDDITDNVMMRCLMCPHSTEFKRVKLPYHFEVYHGLVSVSHRYVCALCYKFNGTMAMVEKHHRESHRHACDEPKVRQFVVPRDEYREIEEERAKILQSNGANHEVRQQVNPSVSHHQTSEKNTNSQSLEKKDNDKYLKRKKNNQRFKEFRTSQQTKSPVEVTQSHHISLIDVPSEVTREEREESVKKYKLRKSETKEKRKEKIREYKEFRENKKKNNDVLQIEESHSEDDHDNHKIYINKSKERSPIASTSFAASPQSSSYSISSDDFIVEDDDDFDDDDDYIVDDDNDDDDKLIKPKKTRSKSKYDNYKKSKTKRKKNLRPSEFIVSPRRTDSAEESEHMSDYSFVVDDDVVDEYRDGLCYCTDKNCKKCKRQKRLKNRKGSHSGESTNSHHNKTQKYVCLFCENVFKYKEMKTHLRRHFSNLDNDSRKLERINIWADEFINNQLSLTEFDDKTVTKSKIRCPICVKVAYEIGRKAKKYTKISELNRHLCDHMCWKPTIECAVSECYYKSEESTDYYRNLYCDMRLVTHLNESHREELPRDDECHLRGRKVSKECPLKETERVYLYQRFVRKSDNLFDDYIGNILKFAGMEYECMLKAQYLNPDKYDPTVVIKEILPEHVDFNNSKSVRKFLKHYEYK